MLYQKTNMQMTDPYSQENEMESLVEDMQNPPSTGSIHRRKDASSNHQVRLDMNHSSCAHCSLGKKFERRFIENLTNILEPTHLFH